MAWSLGQVSVGTSSAFLCEVPPGPCEVTLVNGSVTAADIVYFGEGTVTSSGGVPLPAGGTVTLRGLPGSAGATLNAIGVATTAVGVVVVTPS